MKMKPAVPVMITTTTTILVCALAGGLALAQNPSIIQNTRSTMNGVNNRATAASNEALGAPPAASNATSAATASGTAVHSGKSVSAQPAPPPRTGVAKRGPGTVRRVVPGRIVEPKVGIVATVANPKTHEKAIAGAVAAEGSENEAIEEPVVPDAKSNANGRRDPFISPVVSHATGSGCNTGKKCLEIGTVNLRGVVRSDSGFIAVVSNGLNKSYFLRENDPVFNGYVTKITGDSIVFHETLQDRMGKSFTREVVKKITIPAV
jgi:hypothetical protein